MTAKLEFKGKDIDDAINKACVKLHVSREELDIKIISTGSTGIFGLCKKNAIIQAKKKELSTPSKKEKIIASHPKKKTRSAASKDKKVKDVSKASGEKNSTTTKKTSKTKAAKPVSPSEKNNTASPPDNRATPSAEVIDYLKSNLKRILELMHFPSEVSATVKEKKIFLQLAGDYTDDLTAKDGLLLDSLQYLLRKMISITYTHKILFSIDAGNFRETRRTSLIEQAKELALEAKETGKTKTIPPLNPAERRIVHMALQEDNTIRSRSVGDGLFKKVLIYLPGKEKKRSARRRGGKKVTQSKKSSTNRKKAETAS
jgi:spoIIIJ-associated protein